jgi:hypothetical protein
MKKLILLFLITYPLSLLHAQDTARHHVYQSDDRLVFIGGVLVMFQPAVDVGIQFKSYFATDPHCSNVGPGAGCEISFGANSGGVTFGPKVYYQVDKYICSFGGFKSELFFVGKASVIYYAGVANNGLRIAPELGFSIFDTFTLLYGYNFAFNKSSPEVTGNKVSALLTIGGKKHKTNTVPLSPLH